MAEAASDELLTAAQGGDRAALERLLTLHRQGIYRYGLRVCRTTEDAEDAVQETLWAATRTLHAFRGAAASITAWLFTIVRHQCYRLMERDHAQEELGATLVDGDTQPSPEDEIIAQRQREMLAAALAALDPIDRHPILLRDIEGLTAPEAALVLGISVDALKSRLHRARAELREEVSRLQGSRDRRINGAPQVL
jgi:RNA polymerase sigma-70 factor (ECF subfamily)